MGIGNAVPFHCANALRPVVKNSPTRPARRGAWSSRAVNPCAPTFPTSRSGTSGACGRSCSNLYGQCDPDSTPERGEVGLSLVVECEGPCETTLAFTRARHRIGIPCEKRRRYSRPYAMQTDPRRPVWGTGLGSLSPQSSPIFGRIAFGVESEVGGAKSSFHFITGGFSVVDRPGPCPAPGIGALWRKVAPLLICI